MDDLIEDTRAEIDGLTASRSQKIVAGDLRGVRELERRIKELVDRLSSAASGQKVYWCESCSSSFTSPVTPLVCPEGHEDRWRCEDPLCPRSELHFHTEPEESIAWSTANIPKVLYCMLVLAVPVIGLVAAVYAGAGFSTIVGLEEAWVYEDCYDYADRRTVCVELDEPRKELEGEGLLFMVAAAAFIGTVTITGNIWHRGYIRWFDDAPFVERVRRWSAKG